jgi:hypothetical protein
MSFIEFDKIEAGCALAVKVSKARFLKQGAKSFAGWVAPASLLHKPIEYVDLTGVGSTTVSKTPFQNLFVRAAGEHTIAESSVLDVQKRKTMAIELAP